MSLNFCCLNFFPTLLLENLALDTSTHYSAPEGGRGRMMILWYVSPIVFVFGFFKYVKTCEYIYQRKTAIVNSGLLNWKITGTAKKRLEYMGCSLLLRNENSLTELPNSAILISTESLNYKLTWRCIIGLGTSAMHCNSNIIQGASFVCHLPPQT